MSSDPPLTLDVADVTGLVPTGARIVEAVSQSFRADVLVRSTRSDLAAGDLLDKSATLSFPLAGGDQVRTLNGLISRVTLRGADGDGNLLYRIRLRSWLWFLRRTATCAAFRSLTVPEIVDAVIARLQLGPYEASLTGSYAARDLCVQYNESDAHFIARLLESEGISYVFAHADGEHTLRLIDDLSTAESVANYDAVPFAAGSGIGGHAADCFRTWRNRRSRPTDQVTRTDYDYTKPRVDLTQTAIAEGVTPQFERFAYPGRFSDDATGEARVSSELERHQSLGDVVEATGHVRGLQPGCKVALTGHPSDDQNRDYVVLHAEHAIGNPFAAPSDNWYDGRYRLQPAEVPVRPPRRTKRPRIAGPQTAVVVGQSDDDEVCTDSYGRVLVRFPWDRSDDSASTAWVRCVQSLAGSGFGSFALPRVGQEVVVEFLGGNPDAPLVTGTVFNADMTGPLNLPGQASCTSLKTKTIGSSSAADGHELTFDDTADAEQITLRSQRDFTRVVRNNDSLTVGEDDADDGSQTVTIKSNRGVTISEGDDTLTVAQGDLTVEATGGSVTISAGQQLTLQVGASSITLDASGVSIAGTNINIDATGTLATSGAEIEEKASAMLTLQGAMVQIN